MKKISIVGKGNKKEEKKLDFSMLVTILILLPNSFAIIVAIVVLPKPGGP